jgi:hypothetical protein
MSLLLARELPNESNSADFKNFLKAPLSLFDFDVYRAALYARSATACASQQTLATCTNSAHFVRNGAFRFHAAPITYVANIHQTPRNRRTFLCFHRPITAGTPNDRWIIHTILHSPGPQSLHQPENEFSLYVLIMAHQPLELLGLHSASSDSQDR